MGPNCQVISELWCKAEGFVKVEVRVRMGALYVNEVSNSCAIQKELNRLFGQVNLLGNLGNRNSYNGKL